MSDLTAEMTDSLTGNLTIGQETMDVNNEHQNSQLLVDPQTNDVVISEKTVTRIENAVTNYADQVIPDTNSSYMNNGEHLEITVEGNEVIITTNDDVSKYEGDISANEEVTTADDDQDMTNDTMDAVYDVASINEELVNAGENVVSTDNEIYVNRIEISVDENAAPIADENMVAFNEPQSIDAVTDEVSACKIVDSVENAAATCIDDTAVVCIDENASITNEIELCNNEQLFQNHQPAMETVSDVKTIVDEPIAAVDDVNSDEITAVDGNTVASVDLVSDTNHIDEKINEDVTVDANPIPDESDIVGENVVANEDATAADESAIADESATADESAIADESATADENATADESTAADESAATADEITSAGENTTADENTTGDEYYSTASNEVTGNSEQPAASDETAKSSNSDVIKFEFVELESSGVFGEEAATQSDNNMFVPRTDVNVDEAETASAEPAAPVNDEESAIFGDVSTQNDDTSAVETSAAVDDSSAGETVEQIEAELNKSYESAADSGSVANEPSPQNATAKSPAKSAVNDYKRPTHIPPHLMGRDISNPTKDLIGTGRRVQKPRLGVKVPYRNLTSQIVSQDEIAQEIFERTRRKFKYYESVEKNDILSSLKLPPRISTKINVDEVIKKKKTKKNESTTTAAVVEPRPPPIEATATVDECEIVSDKNTSALDSKVEELYAEISSTLAEDCPVVTEAVAKSTPAAARAADSSTSLNSTAAVLAAATKVVNGDAVPSNAAAAAPEASLDHDTLLAILEDGPDANETAESSDISITTIGGSMTPAATRRAAIDGAKLAAQQTAAGGSSSGKRQKRVRVALDPNVEKELALKQLMDFEANSRRGRRAKNAQPARNENGLVVAHNATATTTAAADEQAAKLDSVERKAKRTPIYSLAPKRFPKKYQRIIKRQIRSLKMKTKTNSSGGVASSTTTPEPAPTPPPPQKKLPEVPEVQIAIDRYIKTYASKRKRQPDDKTTTTEKPPEKKAREDENAAVAAPPEVVTIDDSPPATAAVTRSTDVDRVPPQKSRVASTSATTRKSAAAPAPKIVASTPKAAAVASSPKIAATSTPKTVAASKPKAASTPKAAATTSTPKAATATSTPKAATATSTPKAAAASTSKPSAAAKKQMAAKGAPAAAAKAKPKVNSRMMREMNRLLGDEGAINMIYSVERKRLAEYRSGGGDGDRKKDLVSKQKMVKNAVLRLSMSSSPEVVSRRRISPETSTTDGDGNVSTAVAATTTTTTPAKVRQAPQAIEAAKTAPVVAPAAAAKTKAAEPLSLPPAKQRRLVAAEASRIIRRHSSSSSSGDEEPVAAAPVAVAEPPERPSSSGVEANNNECAAKENKKDAKVKSPKDRRESKDAGPSGEVNVAGAATTAITDNSYEISKQSYKEISLRVYDHLVHIVLASTTARMKNAVNLQMLHELINVLRGLEKEDKCKAVLVTSTGGDFCQGVDLQTLTRADRTERVKIVDEFVNTLTDFTKCLSEFRKILIAGVNGAASGLGVTMLPFFDMVFATDKATFKTPYVKLGQIPEAGATITLPRVLGNAVAKELFFSGRTLSADEAARYGLAVRVFQSDKFDAESSSLAKNMADQSAQSMEATKMLLKRGTTSNLDEQLELEAKLLKEQWCSDECQRRFEEYLQEAVTFDN